MTRRHVHLRRFDWIAVAGVVAGIVGAVLFKYGVESMPVVVTLIAAAVLWYLGFAMLLLWSFVRILASGADENASKLRGWVRDKFIEAAGKVFAEVGFDAATVQKICSLAGIDVAIVNSQFGDKLGIYTEVIRSSTFAQQEPAIEAAFADSSNPRDALRELICQWFERTSNGGIPSWFARIMSTEMARPTPALDRVAQAMGTNYLRFRTLVGQIIGCDANDVRTRMCVHSIVGQILHYVQSRAMLARLWPELNLDHEAQRRAIAEHIVAFSIGGMTALSDEAGRR